MNRTAAALGVFVLGLLIWTRASDMPEHSPTDAKPLPATSDVSQNFPAEPPPATRHVSAVLAFDAALVRATDQASDATEFLEAGAHVPANARVSFRLYNRGPQSAYFLLFGAAGDGTLHWFYPPDAGAGANRSLPLAPVPTVELPEPVTLPANLTNFTLVGLFTDAPVTIAEVKQTWATGGAGALQSTLHAQVQQLSLNAHQP